MNVKHENLTDIIVDEEKNNDKYNKDQEWFWKIVIKFIVIMWILFVTCFLPWSVWVTTNIFKSSAHVDGSCELIDSLKNLGSKLEKLEEKVGQPENTRERITKLEIQNEEFRKTISAMDKENRDNYVGIKIVLEGMKVQLDTLVKNSEKKQLPSG